MKRQKKRLIIALIAVIVLGIAYAALMLNPASDSEDEDSSAALTEIDSDSVTKIDVELRDGDSFAIEYETTDDGTTYKMTGGNEDGRYDENVMSELLSTASAVSGTLVEPSCTELDTYGLDSSDAVDTVTVTADDKDTTLLFGLTSDALGGTYCRSADNTDVYFVSSDTVETLLAPQDDYLLMQVLTSYYSLSTDMESMTVSDLNGVKFSVEKRDTGDMDDDVASAYSDYVITAPQSCSANDTALSTGILSDLQDGLTANSIAKSNAKKKDLSKYGLDDPKASIELTFANDSETVLVGDTDGDTTYVMTKGGSTVFCCNSESFAFLDDDSWTDYRSSQLIELAESQMQTVTMTEGKKSYTAEFEYVPADENEDDDTDKMTGTLDGEEIDEDAISQIYSALTNLDFTAETDPQTADSPLLSLSVTLTDGTEHTLSFIKGGSREYIADVDGSGYIYTVSKADYDTLVAAFEDNA